MRHAITIIALAFLVQGLMPAACESGMNYRITSKIGDKTITYEVGFGGGLAFERHTAFDPKSKKFVHLDWQRNGAAPKPVAEIWDHRTGETIPLYKFPGVEQPLPVIPGVGAMKVCPLTGDKNFKVQPTSVYD